ncbi:hypothetical protein IT568_03130 [bacterium]|nr:hypothetical protein [bacterium]
MSKELTKRNLLSIKKSRDYNYRQEKKLKKERKIAKAQQPKVSKDVFDWKEKLLEIENEDLE